MLRSVKNRPLLLYILFVFKLLSNHFFKQRVPETVGIDSVTEFFHIVYKTYDNLAFCKENYADCSQGPIQQSPPQQMHSCLVECGCAHHSGFALVGGDVKGVLFDKFLCRLCSDGCAGGCHAEDALKNLQEHCLLNLKLVIGNLSRNIVHEVNTGGNALGKTLFCPAVH